jgi:CheY-specific phosphatase CheX
VTSQPSTQQAVGNPHGDVVPKALEQVMSSTCGVAIAPCADDPDLASDGVIIAVISLVGDLEWSIFLGLPRRTAAALAQMFAGFEIPFESEDMGDAIGEVTNIMAGQVKAILDSRGLLVEISLPSVIRANNLEVLVQRGSAGQKTCYQSDLGKLWTGVVASGEPGLVL